MIALLKKGVVGASVITSNNLCCHAIAQLKELVELGYDLMKNHRGFHVCKNCRSRIGNELRMFRIGDEDDWEGSDLIGR